VNVSFTRRTLALAGVAVALVAAVAAIAAPAQAASPAYWSVERAEFAAVVDDLPEGCSYKVWRGWVGNCVAPDYSIGRADCVGTGPRIIHPTEDVYLYKTFKCEIDTMTWTAAGIRKHRDDKPQGAYGITDPGYGGVRGTGTLRVKVASRFTALVTWRGWVWRQTIRIAEGGEMPPVALPQR
jgi:hypothetical protein